MNRTPIKSYNIHWTLLGGQSHAWEFDGEWYWGHLLGKIVKLRLEKKSPVFAKVSPDRQAPNPNNTKNSILNTKNSILTWQTFPIKDDYDFLKKYLRLDVDYENILNKINKDEYMQKAIKKFPNLRLINQGLEEGLLSYLFSANKNLAGIRKSIKNLRELVGHSILIDGEKRFMFPKSEMIYEKSEKELRTTGMGFRAKYLMNALKEIVENNFLEKVKTLNEENARKELLKIKGVGEKIADCVLIYGMGFDNVSPLDVWGHRIVEDYYGLDKKLKYNKKRKWFSDYFEGHAGWAGQFLYEYIRTEK